MGNRCVVPGARDQANSKGRHAIQGGDMGERQVSVMINAPPEIVFGLYTDAGQVREWLSGAREVHTVGPTDQPGGRAAIVYRGPSRWRPRCWRWNDRPATFSASRSCSGWSPARPPPGSGGSRAEPSYTLGWPTGGPEDPSAASLTPASGRDGHDEPQGPRQAQGAGRGASQHPQELTGVRSPGQGPRLARRAAGWCQRPAP